MNPDAVSIIGASFPFSGLHTSSFTPYKKCTTRTCSNRVPPKFHPTKHTFKIKASTFSPSPRKKIALGTAAAAAAAAAMDSRPVGSCDFRMAPSDKPETGLSLASGAPPVSSLEIVESDSFSPRASSFASNRSEEQRWSSSEHSSQQLVACPAATRGHLNQRSHVEARQRRAASIALELLQYYDPVRDSHSISLVKIVDVNDSFCHCLGFKRKMNLIGANILKFIPSSGHAQWQLFIEDALSSTDNPPSHSTLCSDMMFVCKDGTHLLTRIRLHILKPPLSGDEQGRTTITALLELVSDFSANPPSSPTERICRF